MNVLIVVMFVVFELLPSGLFAGAAPPSIPEFILHLAIAFSLAVAPIAWYFHRLRRFVRIAKGNRVCWNCLYALRGLGDGVSRCPECGFSIPNSEALLARHFRSPEFRNDFVAERQEQCGRPGRRSGPPLLRAPAIATIVFAPLAMFTWVFIIPSLPGAPFSYAALEDDIAKAYFISGAAVALLPFAWGLWRERRFNQAMHGRLSCWRCLQPLSLASAACPKCGLSVDETKSLLQHYYRMPEPWVGGSSEE